MTAPTITNSKSTTATKYGGDALNNLNNFLNGVDVTSTIGTPIIRTPTKFPSDKLIFTDPAEDNTVIVKIPTLSTNKTINLIPTNVGVDDEVVFKDTVQTVTGKVISASSNTISEIDVSNLAAASNILTTTNTKTVTNKTISGSSNTLSNIPDSAISAVNYSKLTGTPPKLDDLSTPDDNTDLNSTTSHHGLLRKLSNTATEFMNGTGSWSVPTFPEGPGTIAMMSGSELFSGDGIETEFTIAHGMTDFVPGSASVTPRSSDALGNYTVDVDTTNITITYPIPPPSGTNNLDFFWVVFAPEGEVPSPPAHASSHGSGGSDSIKLDDLAAPDDNTDLNVSNTKHGLIPKLGSANQIAKVNSGATALEYTTLDVTLDSNALTTSNTKTATNKTINATDNTITDTSTATGDLLASNGTKFLKKARGSANQVLATNSGGTDIAWSLDPVKYNTYTYVVWIESGPTYKAKRTSTGVITSDTNAQTLFETIINAMATGSGNVGGKIYVHEGVYPVTTRIKIGNGTYPNSQVEIEGAGKDVTIFRYTGTSTEDGDESIFMPFCHTDIRNLTVDGNDLSTHNITCTQAVRIGLYNIRSIKHVGIGIYIASTVKGFDIRSCQIDDPSGAQDQIALNCIDYGFFIGNFVDRRTGDVLTASSVTAASLTNAVIADNVILREPGADELQGASLALENWDKNYKNVTIENNIFYKGYVRIGSGHDVAGGATFRNIVFNNNVLDGATFWIDGPSATSAASTHKDIRVNGNIISDSWDVGIRVVKAAGPITLSNNTIKESNRSGVSNASNNKGLMFIDDSDFVTINDNILHMTNSGTNRSLMGVRVQGASDRTTLRDNTFYITNSGVALSDSGNNTNLKKYDNVGLEEGIDSFTTSLTNIYTNPYDNLVKRVQFSQYFPQVYTGGSGYFAGFTGTVGSNSYSTTSGPGGARIVETGAVSGNKAGQSTDKGLRRATRPAFVFVIRPNTTLANQGIFIGFASTSDGTSVHATTPINAQSGVGMAMTTDKANYQFVTNDGTSGCQFYDTGVATDLTTIRTFEVWFDGTNWYGRVDNSSSLTFTLSTDIPASSTVLFPQFFNVTNTAALANFYHYGMVLRNYSVEQ